MAEDSRGPAGWRALMTRPRVEFTWQLNIGQVLQILAILCAGIFFAVRLESQIALNSNDIKHHKERLESIELRATRDVDEIKRHIEDLRNYLMPPRRGPY